MLPKKRPGLTARILCERLDNAGYQVSKRTIERDLIELSRIFPIESNEKSIPYGWHWRRDAKLDLPSMELTEAVSLGLLEDLLQQLVPPNLSESLKGRFIEAHDKLKALSNNRFSKWTDLVRYIPAGLPLLKPKIHSEVQLKVQESLLQMRQLKIIYVKANSHEPKEKIVHPHALIQQGERSYLLATTFDYDQLLHYALHRIRKIEILEEPAKRIKGFSLNEHLQKGGGLFGTGASIILKANLSSELAEILHETPISTDQKISTRAGKNILTATVYDSWQLHFWILSQGSYITVQQPVSLKKHIVAQLRAALTNYDATKV